MFVVFWFIWNFVSKLSGKCYVFVMWYVKSLIFWFVSVWLLKFLFLVCIDGWWLMFVVWKWFIRCCFGFFGCGNGVIKFCCIVVWFVRCLICFSVYVFRCGDFFLVLLLVLKLDNYGILCNVFVDDVEKVCSVDWL